MQLPEPVSISFPPISLPNGESFTRDPVVLTELEVTISDNATRRICEAVVLNGVRFPLWRGPEYDAAGDYTQAQAEARVLEVLGPDIKAGIESLL
jgi:hypothetical protein